MSRFVVVILAICIISLSGCGTFSDAMCGPATDDVYYRGVGFDVMAVSEDGGKKAFMVFDIPFSLIADTLLVPYLAYHQLIDPRPKRTQSKPDELGEAVPRESDPRWEAIPKE